MTLQIRKRDEVKHSDNDDLKFQGLQAPDAVEQQDNMQGIEQQQQPPVRHMVRYFFVVLLIQNGINFKFDYLPKFRYSWWPFDTYSNIAECPRWLICTCFFNCFGKM